jgi:predicted metalloprotease with PDZ domain
MRLLGILLGLLAVCFGDISLVKADQDALQVEIDARDLPRKLLNARLSIPLTESPTEQKVALWYPMWLPGSHGPSGPIANVAGIRIEDQSGRILDWQRTPGEVYRLEVSVPAHTKGLRVSMRYITNQPSVGSMGHDSWGSSKLGVISLNTILLYPEVVDVNTQQVVTTLLLPEQWKASTALPLDETVNDSAKISFKQVSLSQFVDSPIMCGEHHRTYDLVEPEFAKHIPAHRLQVFGDEPSHSVVHEDILRKFRSMVTQAALLTRSHPFDQFDILLGVTSNLPANGLEHARSSFNVLSPKALSSLDKLRGWDRLLIPHEYMHAWCGKYRRPAGMVSTSFHAPENTELLWVYEGLTQYLGELVEARCGLMSKDQFRHRLFVELRIATYQQGREWRTLADTGAAAHILRAGSNSWSGLRRSQDFYMEGMLFWLEADAILRSESGGNKSLDDFCHEFFRVSGDGPNPNPYTREDLVRILDSLVPFDWDGLIRRRIESFQSAFDPSVAGLLGYRFELGSKTSSVPPDTFRSSGGVDAFDSVGATFTNEGKVRDLLLGSPADRARLMPDMKVVGIGNYQWSATRWAEALEESKKGKPIELKIAEGDEIKSIQLDYSDGPRWLTLVRQSDSADVLSKILKPLVK